MSLSIIIVSWNTRELTLKCLKSIFEFVKNIDFAIYLVDNNSSDGTVDAVEKSGLPASSADRKAGVTNNFVTPNFSSENLHIIANKENVGFARANNQALITLFCHSRPRSKSRAGSSGNLVELWDPHFRGDDNVGTGLDLSLRSEYVLLLNPDTEFVDDKIKQAIDFMETHPDIGIFGPKLLNSDMTLQKSCRRFPGILDQLFIQLKFYNFFPEKIKATRDYFMLDFDYNEIKEVDQVMGAAVLVRREVIEKIGLLDEKLWAIFEEVDFCKRAKDAGYKIYFYPDWQIIHHKEQSFKQWPSLRKQTNFNRSLYYYFKKHKPFWQLFLLWLAQPINLLLTIVDTIFGIRKKQGKSKNL